MQRIMAFLLVFILSTLGFTSSQAAETASKAAFTPAQQTAIENTIRDYLLAHPEILMQMAQKLQKQQATAMQQQAQQAIQTNLGKLFLAPNSPTIGNTKGNVTLVEFLDFQCPHCRDVGPVITQLIKSNPNLRVVFKELPIFGPPSEFASRVALAVYQQQPDKYAALNQALLKAKAPFTQEQVLGVVKSLGIDANKINAAISNPAITQELNDNLALANALGLQGTPTFIIAKTPASAQTKLTDKQFIYFPGVVPAQALQQAITQISKS